MLRTNYHEAQLSWKVSGRTLGTRVAIVPSYAARTVRRAPFWLDTFSSRAKIVDAENDESSHGEQRARQSEERERADADTLARPLFHRDGRLLRVGARRPRADPGSPPYCICSPVGTGSVEADPLVTSMPCS
jgi:hypothetical protein